MSAFWQRWPYGRNTSPDGSASYASSTASARSTPRPASASPCAKGDMLTGGGYSPSLTDTKVISSGPDVGGWRVIAQGETGSVVRVFALCLHLTGP